MSEGNPSASARADGSSADLPLKTSLMTASEVADLLGVPTTWVYEQSRLGRIPTVTLGRYRRYRPEAIAVWVKELEADTSPARSRSGRGRGRAVRGSASASVGALRD